MSTATGGAASGSVAVSGPSDGKQAIAQLESMVKEAQRELLTSDQAEAAARQIAEFKRTAFPSRDAFVEASVANRILVLSDDDVDILKSLDADRRLRIKALYALACDRLDGTMLEFLKGFRNLAILDLSYSNGPTWQETKTAFSRGVDLGVLQHLYLRRSRRLSHDGVRCWLRQATQLEGLYLDGSTEVTDWVVAPVAHHLIVEKRPLQTLSIHGCSQLATRDFRDGMEDVMAMRPQFKVIGP